MKFRFGITILLLFSIIFSFGQTAKKNKGPSTSEIYELFKNPEMKYRPFVRWWWNGDKVEPGELLRELHVLKDVGIGGVEINPIEFPAHGDDDMGIPSLTWLSDQWIDALKVTLDTAASIGLFADLIVGSGWPFGGEHLAEEDRAVILTNYTKKLKGPMKLEISRDALYSEADLKISSPYMGRKMQLERLILLETPCSDLDKIIDLTHFEKNSVFYYDLPEGEYTLSALIKITGFLKVIDGASGASGPVLNHFDKNVVNRYLNRMSSAISQKITDLWRYLRAFFIDSMELEGMNWSDDMIAEFRKRRGYDLEPYLPFFICKTHKMGDPVSYDPPIEVSDSLTDIIQRVRYDFELVKAELLRENFLNTYSDWCDSMGVKSRAQAYGRGLFPLESSMCVDIPEGESWTTNYLKHTPGEEMSEVDYRRGRAYTMINKYISSAAHLTDKRIVSCEEMTNTYRVFNMSMQYLKLGGDQTIASGITHSIFHGFNYMPQNAHFPGWIRYGAYYNEKNTWWPYFHYYNDYKARLYSVLQNCDNIADIAILTPVADMWTKIGMQNEPFPSRINAPYQTLIWESIVKNGGSCDYVSEEVIRNSSVSGKNLCYSNKKYNTIFLINVESLSLEAAVKLKKFAISGGKIICIETIPYKSLGLHTDNLTEDKKVSDCFSYVKTNFPNNIVFVKKPDSNYIDWYKNLQRENNIPHAMNVENPDPYFMQIHYRTDDGNDVFFITHSHRYKNYEANISFSEKICKGKKLYIWDPETGKRYVFKDKTKIPNDFNLIMGPASSYLLVLDDKKETQDEFVNFDEESKNLQSIDLSRNWKLSAKHAFECKQFEIQMDTLSPLNEIPALNYIDDSGKQLYFAGTACYTRKFYIENPSKTYLDLGLVEGISECSVNGNELGIRWYGSHKYIIPSEYLKKGENTLEIRLTTTMGNYMKSLTDNPIAQYWTNKGNKIQQIQTIGLLGPIQIKISDSHSVKEAEGK